MTGSRSRSPGSLRHGLSDTRASEFAGRTVAYRSNRQPNILGKLSQQERTAVLRHGVRHKILRGETLFAQGERHHGVFIIETGLIRTFLRLAVWPRDHTGVLEARQHRRHADGPWHRRLHLVRRCIGRYVCTGVSRQRSARIDAQNTFARHRYGGSARVQGKLPFSSRPDARHPRCLLSGLPCC